MIIRKLLPVCGALLSILASGCSSDEFESDTPVEQQKPTATSEVIIQIPIDYTLDEDESRAAPPGGGSNAGYNPLDDEEEALNDISKVDRIRLITFCSKDDSDFIYDEDNDVTLNVAYPEDLEETDNGHKHLIKRHSLQKKEGCRYRIVALAYSSTTVSSFPSEAFSLPAAGDNNWFSLNCDTEQNVTFENFKLTLVQRDCSGWNDFRKTLSTNLGTANYKGISDNPVETPQLFYGVCTNSSGSEIIDYYELDKYGSKRSDLPVTGVLKRAVAKVDLIITPRTYKPALISYNPTWLAILADNPRLTSKLTSYDDFLPQALKDNPDDDYQPVAYLPLETSDLDQPHRITMWFLPGKTRLAIRIRNKVNAGIDYLRNGQITKSNDEQSTGGNATGVLSPDLIDGEFYFRRNHKYVIVVSQPDNILANSSLK